MGLLPLGWLAGLAAVGQRRSAAWWWLAGAFGISWLADWAAHVVNAWTVGAIYPVSQSALIVAVLAPIETAAIFAVLLLVVGLAAVLMEPLTQPDLLLRTVAWGGLVLIVWPRRDLGRLHSALLLAFGVGWVAWIAYALHPGWPTWGVYQGVRAVSLLWFCWVAWKGRVLRPCT